MSREDHGLHVQPNRVEETEALHRKERIINGLRGTLASEASKFQEVISDLERRIGELVRKNLLLEDKSAKQQRDISQYRDDVVPGLQFEIAKLESSESREQRSNSTNPPVSRFAHKLYEEECKRLQAANAVLLAENARLVRERQSIVQENQRVMKEMEEALTAENAEFFTRTVSAESQVRHVSVENVVLREENQRLRAQLQARQLPLRAHRSSGSNSVPGFFVGVSDAMPRAPLGAQHNAASDTPVARGYGRR